mmetsp:Transcript_84906/g.155687  ORF Transcript_84906/g.155687 Transcript_84906/m.155687 type:complete len:251 (+) Transcript_84906:108-860(+)
MGQAVLSNQLEHMREMAIATCPGCAPSSIARPCLSMAAPIRVEVAISCPGSSCSKASPHRSKLEDIMSEVEEVRQENQRLQLRTQEIRYLPVKDAAPMSNAQADPQQQEMLKLKRRLWDLQRENSEIKESISRQAKGQGTAFASRATQGGPRASPDGSFHSGSFNAAAMSPEELQALERQVSELQRVTDLAAQQTSQLRSQQAAHDKLRRAASVEESPKASDGSVRRKVEALRTENEALRRKVRMLAVAA